MDDCVRTTCPYCGVGCGVLAGREPDGTATIQGDPDHPSNYGRLCSKGSALVQTLDLEGRLLHPEVNGKQCGWDQAIATVANGFSGIIDRHGPDAVAFYVSGQLLTEDYYVANKLIKGYIGTANIDTNSRLCMASSVAGHKRAFGADVVPCCYEDLERAKLIVLVGSNAAWCHPILYQRMIAAKRSHPDLVIVVIDPRTTASCDMADIHLPLKPGTDAILFNGLLSYMDEQGEGNALYVNQFTEGAEAALAAARHSAPDIESVARQCGLKNEEVAEFYRIFARTERVVTVYSQGVNQSSSGTDKVNAIINCHLLTGRIGRPGMGPFSFTGQPNAMGGREVGGLANQLAAHMEIGDPQSRDRVQRFWNSPRIAEQAGLKAVDLFKAIDEGRIKAVWIMATNPVVSLPDADRVKAALEKCELVVISDCVRHTDTTEHAHVLLPALAWGEKEGSVTNSERRISRQRAFLEGPGSAKPDWWIVSQVARQMGYGDAFAYSGPADIFDEHARLSAFENEGERSFNLTALAGMSEPEYQNLEPVQWPVTERNGTTRMFSDGRFFTESGKARFVTVDPRPPVNAPDSDFPYILNTGRVRDQWHTMTRTGKAARLSEHSPEPYVEIHPRDAAEEGIDDGMLVNVFSRWGEVTVRCRINEGQARGSVFIPMHWNDQFCANGRVDALVNPVTDPISGQPESKHTPVRLKAYVPAWHGFLLSRRMLVLEGASYWARAKGDGYYRYELAGEQLTEEWPQWARRIMCDSDGDVNWVEYLDRGAARYRGVRLVGKRVESCLFIAPNQALPPRSWLGGLFAQSDLTDEERKGLLLGAAPKGTCDTGKIVCACFSVGENTLLEAIRSQRLTTPEAVGELLKAGTNCGSCVPEIKSLIMAAGH